MRRCSRCGSVGHTKRTCERRESGEIAQGFEWDLLGQHGAALAKLRADVDFLLSETELLTVENSMLWAWIHMAGLTGENQPQKRTLASFSTSDG